MLHWAREYMKLINEKIKNLDLEDDKSIIKFIDTMETALYFGKNADGDNITVGVEKSVGMRISTYQKNNWIRINDYYIEIDDVTKQRFIVKTEGYEK